MYSIFRKYILRGTLCTLWCKKSIYIQVEHVFPWNEERATGIILYAGIVLVIAQLFCHPRLRFGQVHSLGHDEDQATTFGAGGDMRHHDTQFLCFGNVPIPPFAWVRNVVEVVHGQAARNGFVVLPPPVLEGGVRGENRQTLLELSF